MESLKVTDNMKELVTIIVPVYNVSGYLEKSIESVLQQTYYNLEIILVDDGSTDDSGAVCEEYAATDNRIKVIHQENKGQGAARNAGLDIAKGRYIYFHDSDDCINEDCIEFLYTLLKKHSLDIAACNYGYYDETGRMLRQYCEGMGTINMTGIEAIESSWSRGVMYIAPWGKLYDKKIFEELRFRECFGEDFATMHYAYEKAEKVGYDYSCKVKYTVRSGSDTVTFNPKKLQLINTVRNNLLFAEKYPTLRRAARQKAVDVYFHILFQLPEEERYFNSKSELESLIRELRRPVLFDKKCDKKTRIALLLSYFGFGFTKKIFELKKKKDITF